MRNLRIIQEKIVCLLMLFIAVMGVLGEKFLSYSPISASNNTYIFNEKIQNMPYIDSVLTYNIPSIIGVGEIFTVSVVLSSAINVGGLEATTLFSPSLVTVEEISLGPFLNSTGRTVIMLPPVIDNINGLLTYAFSSLGTTNGPSGNGVVLYIRMKAKSSGINILSFSMPLVSDIQGYPILVVQESGLIRIMRNAKRIFIPNTRRNVAVIW